MTSKPNPFPQCGGPNQPACPPTPAAGVNFTLDQVNSHGAENYQKGKDDLAVAINAVLDDPGPAWGDGELARAIRSVLS